MSVAPFVYCLSMSHQDDDEEEKDDDDNDDDDDIPVEWQAASR